jgi:hypothetical protein
MKRQRPTVFLFVSIGFVLLVVSRPARADPSATVDLVTLAKNHFTQFKSDDEKAVFYTFFQSVQEGRKTDLRPNIENVSDSRDLKILTDPVNAGLWADDRVIKAEWINWLCTDVEASKKVTSRGIEIDEARISGQMDLSWLKLEFPIIIFKCGFTDDVILDRTTIRSLQLQTTYLKGLHGDGLSIDRDLTLQDHCFAQGVLWLQEATIGGSLNCDGSQFSGDEKHGSINLKFAKIGATVLFGTGFRAQGEVSLQDASVGATVRCDGGTFINPGGVALNLQGAKTGSVFLRRGFRAEGLVWLYQIAIAGSLQCDDGQFINPGGQALNIQLAKTWAILLRDGFKAQGEVTLVQATIDGALDCGGGQFINPKGTALDLSDTKTGTVFLRNGFRAEGIVGLQGATIGGNLNCSYGHFFNSGGTAIYAVLTNIRGSVYLENFEDDGLVTFEDALISGGFSASQINWAKGSVLDLTSAKVKTLSNVFTGWPPQNNLRLHAFTFDEIHKDASLEAEFQERWIRLQRPDTFRAQPFEMMARVLRNMGREEAATDTIIAKNWDYGTHIGLQFPEVFWYYLLGPLIGYGYRPWNAFYLSLLFIGIGWVLFHAGQCWGLVTPTNKDAYVNKNSKKENELSDEDLSQFYPRFDAFVYSLETFVPFLKLWMSDYWAPNATRLNCLKVLKRQLPITGRRLRFYLWVHVASGWVLTTLWVGGLTGLLKT